VYFVVMVIAVLVEASYAGTYICINLTYNCNSGWQ